MCVPVLSAHRGLGIPTHVYFPYDRTRPSKDGEVKSSPLVIGSFNVCGFCKTETKREEGVKLSMTEKMNVLALSETNVRGKDETEFASVTARKSGIDTERAREGEVLW